MAMKWNIASDQPILITVGGVSVVIRKLIGGKAQVVVVDAPREIKVSVSNEDLPPGA